MTAISPETEMLARMWIECDPNRGGEPGSGFHQDDESESGQPRWHWFIPRAEAAQQYLAERGLTLKAGAV